MADISGTTLMMAIQAVHAQTRHYESLLKSETLTRKARECVSGAREGARAHHPDSHSSRVRIGRAPAVSRQILSR